MISNVYNKIVARQKGRCYEWSRWGIFDGNVQILGRISSLVSTFITGKGQLNYMLSIGHGDMCDIIITKKDASDNGRTMTHKSCHWHVGHLKESCLKDHDGFNHNAFLWMLPRRKLCDSWFGNVQLYQFNGIRGFAKQRKQKMRREEEDEEEEHEEEGAEDESKSDVVATVKTTALLQMEAAIDALSRELAKLRVGRASPGMLDHIMVEHYGDKTLLNRMAVVSVLDPKTLSVTPYDPNSLKELEKAIISSPLGLNPKSENHRLIVPIPPMTKEHIQAVLKVVTKSSENVKQSIRRARQKALESIKKAAAPKKDKGKSGSGLPEDEAKRLEKEIEDLTKKYIDTSEEICKSKEKDISAG